MSSLVSITYKSSIMKNVIPLRFKRINNYMRNGDEQKGEVQRDTSAYRWHELGDDGKQEPDNTLTKEIHW